MDLSKQQLKSLDLNRNIIVTAGAGSGKTTVLVKKYIHILLHNPHLQVNNILAITFTDKAAAEMKDRIFREIDKQFSKKGLQQARIFEILNQLHEPQVSTIHTFCSNILRQYPVEAMVNPDFKILDDLKLANLLNQGFNKFFTEKNLQNLPQTKLILKALRDIPIQKLKSFFLNIYHKRVIIFNFLNSLEASTPPEILHKWEKIFLSYTQPIIEPIIEDQTFWQNLERLINLDTSDRDSESQQKKKLAELFRKYQMTNDQKMRKSHSLIQILQLLTKNNGLAYSRIPGGKNFWGEQGIMLFQKLSETAALYTPDLIRFNEELESEYSQIYLGLGCLLLELLKSVDETKLQLNALDFDDLQIFTLRLLQKNPEIRNQIRSQYKYILVDEFQDTDLLQSRIIYLLSHDQLGKLDTNRLFIVGDPMQSIFAFRNADVRIFLEYQDFIAKQGSEKLPITVNGGRVPLDSSKQERQGVIPLMQNFRSSDNLIRFFNKTFYSLFDHHSEFDVEFQKLETARENIPSQESQVYIDLFINMSDENFHPIEIQAHQIAQYIIKIIGNSKFQKLTMVEDKTELSSIDFIDIALLLRTRTYLNLFEQIFREYQIPYQTYKGVGFYQKQEIQDIYYLLRSIIYPEDNFALLTALRSDFIGLSDVTLFYLSQMKGRIYWIKLQQLLNYIIGKSQVQDIFEDEFAQHLIQNNVAININAQEKENITRLIFKYRQWQKLAHHGSLSQLIDTIIEGLQIRPLLLYQQDGQQRLANLNKFNHYIFEYESSTSTLAVDLLENLGQLITGELKESEAIIMAEEENKVKILTYHSAKGMEFPAVFLPMLERGFKYNQQLLVNQNLGFATDHELFGVHKPFIYDYIMRQDKKMIDAEEKRLLYVAVTRARDYLFLMGSMDQNQQVKDPSYLKWLINTHFISLESLPESRKISFNKEIVIQKHCIRERSDFVTKRKPLEELVPTEADLTQTFQLQYQLPLSEKPLNQIYSVTQLMLFRENPEKYFQQFYLNKDHLIPPQIDMSYADEPGGAVWGTAVHKLLQDYQHRTPKEDKKKIQQIVAQLGFTENNEMSEIQIKLQDIIKQFRADEIGRILQRYSPKSEFAVDMKLGDFILRGIFDILFQNQRGEWEIIDFKTNKIRPKEVEKTAQKYQFQMQAYALLLSEFAQKQQIFPISIYFLEPKQMVSKTYTLIDIESIRIEVVKLLENIFEYEFKVFQINANESP